MTDQPIIMLTTMRIDEGKLEAFKDALSQAIEFVERNGPQLMVQTMVDEQAMRAQSLQVYPDSDAIRTHWELSDPWIRAVDRVMTPERIEVFGSPDGEVLDALRRFTSQGVALGVTPHHAGFSRF